MFTKAIKISIILKILCKINIETLFIFYTNPQRDAMQVNLTEQEVSTLPQSLQENVSQGDNGYNFELSDDNINILAKNDNLKNALKSEREQNKANAKLLKSFQVFAESPEKLKDLIEQQQQVKENLPTGDIDPADFNSILEKRDVSHKNEQQHLKDSYEVKIKAHNDEINSLKNQLLDTNLNSQIIKAAELSGVDPAYMDFVVDAVRKQNRFTLSDKGEIQTMDDDGCIEYQKNPKDYFDKEFRNNYPKMFKEQSGRGGGGLSNQSPTMNLNNGKKVIGHGDNTAIAMNTRDIIEGKVEYKK